MFPLMAGAALAAVGVSLRYTWWRPKVSGIPVLMYHHITDELKNTPYPNLRVSPAKFEAQLDHLAKEGYRTLTLAEAMAEPEAEDAVAITFDDGYQDFLENAWPQLKARNMTATVFLVTSEIGGINTWDLEKKVPRENLMGAEDIRGLAEAGVEFGGHSHTHVDLSRIKAEEMQKEASQCFETLRDLLGKDPVSFSYPFGNWTKATAEAVRLAGFKCSCTTSPGKLGPDTSHYAVPRIIVKRNDDAFDFRIKLARTKSRL